MDKATFFETFLTLSREESMAGHVLVEKITQGQSECPEDIYVYLNLDKGQKLYQFASQRTMDKERFMLNFNKMPVQMFKSFLTRFTSKLSEALPEAYDGWDNVLIKFGLKKAPVEEPITPEDGLGEDERAFLKEIGEMEISPSASLEGLPSLGSSPDSPPVSELELDLDMSLDFEPKQEEDPTPAEEQVPVPELPSVEEQLSSRQTEEPVVSAQPPEEPEVSATVNLAPEPIPVEEPLTKETVERVEEEPKETIPPSPEPSPTTTTSPPSASTTPEQVTQLPSSDTSLVGKGVESLLFEMVKSTEMGKERFSQVMYYLTGRVPVSQDILLTPQDYKEFSEIVKTQIHAKHVKRSMLRTLDLFWRFGEVDLVSRFVDEFMRDLEGAKE